MNKTKTEIKCPYCGSGHSSMAGFSAHLRAMHPDKWKGNTGASLPPGWKGPEFKGAYIARKKKIKTFDGKPVGYNPTVHEVARAISRMGRKGIKKKPIANTCPFCGYKNFHPPGMARHIQATHPDKWKGNLGESLGREPSREWKKTDKPRVSPEDELRLKNRRIYAAGLRKRYKAQGLSSTGRPYKRTLKTFQMANSQVQPEPEKPKGPVRGHADHCPRCGFKLTEVEVAIGLSEWSAQHGK